MAVTLRGRSELQLMQVPKKWKERETSPERTKACAEPNIQNMRRVASVVYYLCRNGQLEHPHFMEVPLSSSEGLFLGDIIKKLSFLRGKGMAIQYSWSSKRSYKNGYVWHDLEENDFIHPVHGQEYVLKGSEILENFLTDKSSEMSSSSSTRKTAKIITSGDEAHSEARNRRRNQSCSSIDLHEYKVYKAECTGDFAQKAAADASTQTDDKRGRRRASEDEGDEPVVEGSMKIQEQSTELSREEISSPPSDSSPEAQESMTKRDRGRLVPSTQTVTQADNDPTDRTANYCPSGRIKASSVLMSLISCGSTSFRDDGAAAVEEHGVPLISQSKPRLPRGENEMGKEIEDPSGSFAKIAPVDKAHFSGSLPAETTKKDEIPGLNRSSSCNSDRTLHLDLAEQERGVLAKCMPRKPKTQLAKREINTEKRS
ncbi:hypothetical protein Nepgr_014610 [Nepenthes gracilis]|uniref:SOSEKI DIX-like domain-containing protein n=1 Tax=Nepenthes gracilis TaxID=150966 RepID=A0AAD3SL79_NEPGR|nr:hypothetical protein Nepgr_014610 [Nepenthes gracilis]